MNIKKAFFPVMLILLISILAFQSPLSADDRREVSFFIGTGTAAKSFTGMFVELGAEIPYNKTFYLQALADYYFAPDGQGAADDSAYGVSLYGVLKFQLSNRWLGFVKAGPTYTIHNTREFAFGLSIPVKNASMGVGAGLGFEYVLAHRLYIRFGGTAKAMTVDGKINFSDSYWFKVYFGFRYLLGVKSNK